jgi:peptide methionine sulfoxide reductase MsrB
MTERIIKMPNHYDIDIHCKKCGAYIGTVYPDEPFFGVDDICVKCRGKEYNEDNKFEVIKKIMKENKRKHKH